MTFTGILIKEQRGFSLVELLVAMFLLCIGLLALFSVFGTTILSNAYAAERADAVRLAQAQMEAVKGIYFDEVVSRPEQQMNRNGITYTCKLVVGERQDNPYLKDVAITVSWNSRRASGGAEEQVELATAVLRR